MSFIIILNIHLIGTTVEVQDVDVCDVQFHEYPIVT